MSFGIALAGGGARGAAHVGVLLALEEEGLRPHAIAGTSSGGIVAGLYATGTTPQMLKELVEEMSLHAAGYLDADLLGILRSVPQFLMTHRIDLSGFLKGNRLERFLRKKTGGKNITETSLRTIIPAVDLNSGLTIAYTNSLRGVARLERVEWKTDLPICEAMRASSAFPVVFQPKLVNGMCLVDGGVTDVLPVDLLIAAGEPNVLAVDVAEEYEMPKSQNLFEISSHSLSIMSTRLKECHSHGEKLLLRPSLPKGTGLLTLEMMTECMEAGYDAARAHMPVLRAFFG